MCGICGIYARQMNPHHEKLVDAILHDQQARGPDYMAKITIGGPSGQIIFGHNRLSIIDLSMESNQPMWDVTGRYCITYNGEIYNYVELRKELQTQGFVFRTQGDTEVILNAFQRWGIDALLHFQGPFAFAIYDKITEQLWLCRDRFGVRPLYYCIRQQTLYFASSTRVLAKSLQLSPNLHYVSQGLKYLVYEDGSDQSPYEHLMLLPAGAFLHASIDNMGDLTTVVRHYYDLTQNVQELATELPIHNTEKLFSLVQDKLDHAIRLRLRTDVPLGITLSSGLDSSSIASCVSKINNDITAFSFGHPSNKKSEGPLVAKCANYLGITTHYIAPTAQEMITALFKTIEAQNAPFASLSIVAQFLLYEQIRANGVKVILGGQGGDEAFMGYRKFMLFQLKQLLKNRNYLQLTKNIFQLIPLFIAETRSLNTYWQQRHRYLQQNSFTSMLNLPETSLQLTTSANCSLRARQIQDITQWSLPTLLRYEDRNAMGNSVESRLPFLDNQLLELGCAIPEAIKLRNGFGKWPIRHIMQDKIPSQIRLAHYKRGFDIPMQSLLQSGLGHAIRTALYGYASVVKNFLRSNATITNVFSDEQLLNRKNALPEAITLLWLGKAYI